MYRNLAFVRTEEFFANRLFGLPIFSVNWFLAVITFVIRTFFNIIFPKLCFIYVMLGVFTFCHNFKIIYTVIKSVSINMMNYFIIFKLPPNINFHQISCILQVLSVYLYPSSAFIIVTAYANSRFAYTFPTWMVFSTHTRIFTTSITKPFLNKFLFNISELSCSRSIRFITATADKFHLDILTDCLYKTRFISYTA